MTEIHHNQHALTGVRPTGSLTVGNYLGAIEPVVNMQESFGGDVSIFVADIHGLTDQEPDVVVANTLSTARALIAAGIDTKRSTLYLQSQIEGESIWLAHMFDRHTTPSELKRVPTLKDKLKGADTEDNVSIALLRYPVLMAADIAVQDATHVPVGKDQLPHIELTRRIVRRVNSAYGDGQAILTEPRELAREAVSVAALHEKHGKMSKSQPTSALLLRDMPDEIARKIKKAHTAAPGEMPAILESHFDMATSLSRREDVGEELARIKAAHLAGEGVMGEFKSIWVDVVNNFLADYRQRYDSISEAEVKAALREGGERAQHTADQVVSRMKKALGFTAIM